MKTLVVMVAAFSISFSVFVQTRILIGQHVNPIGQGHLPSGQGNILHPGVPNSGPPPVRPRGNSSVVRGGRPIYVPYGVAIDPFLAGYGGPYDPNAAGYYSNPPSPTVIINQNFQPDPVHPVLTDYTNVLLPVAGAVQAPPVPGAPVVQRLDQAASQAQELAPSSPHSSALRDDQPTIFLIAMKDHTIYPVIAYWVDKDMLNYVTVDTVVKRVPLDQVDRDLSRQLNDERNVEFKLPSR